MANDYFNHVANRVQAGTRAIAANVNDVADEISAGLDLLPTEDQLKLGTTRYAVDTGVANAYIVTLPYVPTLTDGFNFPWKAVNANTGASTINVNSTGVKAIVNTDGSDLVAGTFGANAIVIVAYEEIAGRFILVSQNPGQAALAQDSAIAAAASAAAASTSEGNAATSESNASASAGAASTSETNAGTSETNAGTSETNAGISETNAAATLADFETKYLGSAASDPTQDLVGGSLIDGALYFNTTTNQMNVYDLGGVSWGPFPDGGNASTLDNLDSTQFLRSDTDDVLTAGGTTTNSLLISETTKTSGELLRVVSDFSGKTGSVASIIQDHASSSAVALTVRADGTGGEGIHVGPMGPGVLYGIFAETTGNNPAIYGLSNGGIGSAGLFYNNSVSSANVLGITNDNASATGTAVIVQQDGTGDALNIAANNAAATAIRAYSNIATRTQPLVEIVNDNATGSGVALSIQNDQGLALDVTVGDVDIADSLNVTAHSEKANQYTATTGTRDLDVATGTYFYPSADLGTATITFTFSNPATSGRVSSFTMELLGADGATLTWPASVAWGVAGEPTWTAGTDIVSFITRDGGTTWNGFAGGFDY